MDGKELRVNPGKTKVLVWFRSPAKTPVPCVSRASAQTPLDQEMADQWQRSQWVGRSLGWYLPSATSGTAYPEVGVVDSLSSPDAVWHGANVMRSCRSSPPSQSPSPPEEGFTICSSGAPCSMQANSGLQPYLICIVCNSMTGSPPRKSARKICWRRCSLQSQTS